MFTKVYGPRRQAKHRAEADLASIRAAAGGWGSRDDAVKAMRTETRRLQRQAEFEARVAMGMDQYEAQRQAHTVTDSDPETEEDDAGDEIWQDLDDPEVRARLCNPPPPPRQEPQEPPQNSVDATARLACFVPRRGSVDELRVLLDARADVNFSPGPGRLSPLQTVIGLGADPDDIAAMRDLLLAHGAAESEGDRKAWHDTQNAFANDPGWLDNFHRSEATLDTDWPRYLRTVAAHLFLPNASAALGVTPNFALRPVLPCHAWLVCVVQRCAL